MVLQRHLSLSRVARIATLSLLLAACRDSTAPVSAAQAALWAAARSGDVAALAIAVEQGADVDALDVRTNDNGRRALNYAAEFNRPAVVHWLAQHGAGLDLGNNRRFTPLHHAAEFGSLEAAVALLQEGADPNVKLASGSTPLAIARQRQHAALVQLLQPVTAP
jgi:ankyrin repeat protein